jgi:hypothetical protein
VVEEEEEGGTEAGMASLEGGSRDMDTEFEGASRAG